MNARNYRVNLTVSPLDFPAISGLGESSVAYQSEPRLNKEKVLLTITKKYLLTDMHTNGQHEILSVKSDYDIPVNCIKSREEVYQFYKDATLSLNEAYQYIRTQLPALHNITFPVPPMENYKPEIDRVLNLLHSLN